MPSMFEAIQFGPFASEYHRMVVNDAFRAALFDFLETHVLPQVTERFDAIQGTLAAKFNEPRHTGPNSAIRDQFKLDLAFLRPTGSDTVTVDLRYEPQAGTFTSRRGAPYLWTAARRKRFNAEELAIGELCAALVRGNVAATVCPRCGLPVDARVAPAMVDIFCRGGCFRYGFHRDPATGEFLHGHFLQGQPTY